MRKNISHLSCPLLTITIMMVLGIIANYYVHTFLSTHVWFALSIILLGIVLTVRHPYMCSLAIHAIVFSLGGTLSSHQQDILSAPAPVYSYEDLPVLDKVQLSTQVFKSQIEEQYDGLNLQSADYGIVSAMTVGDKQFLDTQTKDVFSKTGASHILAVSGLHVGIIFQFFILLLGGRKHSPWAIPIAVIFIWVYTIMIGMPASAIRSSIMTSVYCFILLLRRNTLSLNGLMLAAFIMLCANPQNLFMISFQMSFLAVLAIVVLYKRIFCIIPLDKLPQQFVLNKLFRWVWGMTILSFVAQLGTMPIIAYYFGRISCYALLTNFIAIPAATLIIYLSVTYVLCCFIPFLQHIVGTLISSVARFTNESLAWCSSLPGAYIDNVNITLLQLVLIYLAIFAAIMLVVRMSDSSHST